eukprot:Rmarinus@m.2697
MGNQGSRVASRSWKEAPPKLPAKSTHPIATKIPEAASGILRKAPAAQELESDYTTEKDEDFVTMFRKLENSLSERVVHEALPKDGHQYHPSRQLPQDRTPSSRMDDVHVGGRLTLQQFRDIDADLEASTESVHHVAEKYGIDANVLLAVRAHVRSPVPMETAMGWVAGWNPEEIIERYGRFDPDQTKERTTI